MDFCKEVSFAPSMHVSEAISSSSRHFDLIVVGGGIVGLATARELLLRHKNHSVALLEKEKRLGI